MSNWESQFQLPTATGTNLAAQKDCKTTALSGWLHFKRIGSSFRLRIFGVFVAFLILHAGYVFGYSIGDRVQCTTSGLNIRSGPGTNYTVVAQANTGDLGVIAAGPYSANGYTWYYNQWDTPPHSSGYSVSTYLQVVTPAAPNLYGPGTTSSPGPPITTQMPILQWYPATGATGYELYVYDQTAGGVVYINNGIGNVTSLQLPSGYLTSGHIYKWYMQSKDSAGYSAVSVTYYFQYFAPATVLTSGATSITATSATLNGSVYPNGTPVSVYFEYGTTAYNMSTTPQNISTSLNGQWLVNATVNNLSPNTTYHCQLVANNGGSTTYGGDVPFTTSSAGTVPVVQTLPASNIGTTTATLNAQITDNGGSSILERRFSWGSTPACSDGYTSAVTVNGNNFSYNLAEIPPGTYYFQAWARNSTGWGQSTAASFNTVTPVPVVQTLPPTSVTANSAQINGSVDPNGYTSTAYFEYGPTSNYGTKSSLLPGITTLQNITASWTGLTPNMTYHYRAVAYNSYGTNYGSDYPFVTGNNSLSLTLVTPNGGQNWTAGTSQTISWSVSDPSSQISYYLLDYSLDGGVTWTHSPSFAAYPPAISQSWTIPTGIASAHARVRIEAFNSGAIQIAAGASTSDFTISSSSGNPTAVPTCNNRAPSPGSQVTVNFNGSGSTGSSPSCNITSYQWTFGDGGTATGAYPSHTYYPAAGTATHYTVTLTVTDCSEKQASASLDIYITGMALGNNPTQPTSKDPVNLATGNYTYNHVDLKIPGRGLPFEFQRYYNSKDTASTGVPLGFGWSDSYNIQLSATNNAVGIAYGDGHVELYATNGVGGYVSQPGIYNVLTTSGGNYTLTTKEQEKYNFNSQGQLTSIADKNNNTITLAYTGSNLTTVTDTVGRVISFAYNANNCLTNITDPLGRTVQFAYDANTNLIRVTDTRGGLTQFGYDEYHQITNAIDPRDIIFVSMVYDNEQRVVSCQRDALQGATTFSYDFVDNITTVTDAMNNVSYYHYNTNLCVVEIDDNLGKSQFFAYDTNNNRIQVIDKNGKSTAYAYDGNGNVISKTDPFTSTTTIAYDALNDPTNRLDALNGTTVFNYDAKGNLTNTFNSLGKTNTYQYDAFGQPIIVTDANGNSITNTYDSLGDMTKTVDALGDTNVFAYDLVGRKTEQVDGLSHTNFFIYDNADNLTATVNGLGKTNYFTFDGDNNRTSSTDFNGNATTNIYDAKNRLIAVGDPLGDWTTNVYDALDRKIEVIDPMGNVTQYGYDADGNLLAVTNALGNVTSYAYDPNGNRTNIVDALGNSTTNIFDSLNRLVSTEDPLGHVTTSVYDPLGRRIQGIDALDRTNFFAYDSMGRLTNFTDAAGGTVSYAYDNVGNRLATTDPNGHTTTNEFDALNRLVKITDPDGGVTQLGYDAAGNLISRKDPDGNITTYQYDANNRRTKIIYPTGAPVTFGYDNNGNRTSMTDSLGTTYYTYDALNRLTSVTDPYGQTVSYGYDANGNRISITYPGNRTVHYTYDAMNRLKTATDWLGDTTTYTYDKDGNLIGSVNPNGTATTYQYDPANWLIALTNTDKGAVISSYQYTLDAVGNHSQVNQTEQLPTIPVVGQVSNAYDNDNRMTNSEGQAQTFDANGNMITLNPTNTLSYDYENRLTQTVFAGETNSYLYDGAGNRLAAVRDGVTTRYVLDRQSPLAQVLAETDSNGNVTAYYVYGLGLVCRIDAYNNAEYYQYDSRGSTIALTDAGGQLVEAYAYDPFGRPTGGNITLSDNRFRYLGRHGVMDEENGFLYIRARYYSTKRGRFITKDPTTGTDGDSQSLNRYIYALNNPVRLIDISGLSAEEGTSQNTSGSSDASHNLLFSISSPNVANRIVSLADLITQFGSEEDVVKFLNATAAQGATIKVLGVVGGIITLGVDISEQAHSVHDVSSLASASQAVAINFLTDFTGVSSVGTLLFGNDFHVNGSDLIQGEYVTGILLATGELQLGNAIQYGYLNGITWLGNQGGDLLYNVAPNLFP